MLIIGVKSMGSKVLNELIKLADSLDRKGMSKEASIIDKFIKLSVTDTAPNSQTDETFVDISTPAETYSSGNKIPITRGDLTVAIDGLKQWTQQYVEMKLGETGR